MNQEQKLRTLTKKEIATLFLICLGLTNSQIAEVLKAADKTIGSRITKIYLKLEIEGDDQQKRQTLQRDYCPLARKLSEDDLRYWIPEYPSQEVRTKYEIIEIEYPEPELETEYDNELPYDPLHLPEPRADETYVSTRDVRRLALIFLVIIALLVAGFVILYFFFPPENPLNAPRITEVDTATVEAVVVVPLTDIETPTITPMPSETVTPEEALIVPTSTNTPSSTPTDTPTPTETPIPTPTPEILFFDDYSGDLSKWTQLGFPPYYPDNRASIANDALVTSATYGTWILAEFQADPPYQIIINFEVNSCGYGNFFSPAFNDTFHMIAYSATSCGRAWVYTDGHQRPSKYDGTEEQNGSGDHRLVITVQESKLLAEFNHMDAGSVLNEGHSLGKIGIFLEEGDRVYDVTVIRLP